MTMPAASHLPSPTPALPLPSHVGIVGLGLMGGSLARDLAARGVRVTAFDRDADPTWLLPDDVHLTTTVAEVAAAPVIVLAVPVNASLELLDELRLHITARHVILDTGSTKTHVVARARALGMARRFVGCHPFAGDHHSGWSASRRELFAGATIFICPSPETDPHALEVATALWTAVGGVTQVTDAAQHDQCMALASHLPHLLSVTLSLTLRDAGVPPGALGPGGRDVARLAGGSPEMWVDIVAQNRGAIADALERYEHHFTELRTVVATSSDAELGAMLAAGREWHSARHTT
jgi:prephenate dehydrogenase